MAIDSWNLWKFIPWNKTNFTVIECSKWGSNNQGSTKFVYICTCMFMCKYICMHTCDVAQSIGSSVMLICERFTLESPW